MDRDQIATREELYQEFSDFVNQILDDGFLDHGDPHKRLFWLRTLRRFFLKGDQEITKAVTIMLAVLMQSEEEEQ